MRTSGDNESPVLSRKFDISQVTAVATGVFKSWANPFGRSVLITKVIVEVVNQADQAAELNIGVAADATTVNDGLLDGLSVAAVGLFNNIEDPGANGELCQRWGLSQFLNVAEASGDVAGMSEAYLIIEYVLL